METASPATQSRNVSLDSPPPQPPVGNKSSFMPPPTNGGIGLGDMANSPQIMTMQGLAMAKDAFQLIANGLPDIAPLLTGTISDLEQIVAQAMSANMAGQPMQQAGAPGAMPMMTPPPGPPMPGGMPPGGGGMPPQGGGPGPMPGM